MKTMSSDAILEADASRRTLCLRKLENQLVDTRTDLNSRVSCSAQWLNGCCRRPACVYASAFLDKLPEEIRSSLGGKSLARCIERWNEQIGSYDDFLIKLEELDENFYSGISVALIIILIDRNITNIFAHVLRMSQNTHAQWCVQMYTVRGFALTNVNGRRL
jgi:hypothetical protein